MNPEYESTFVFENDFPAVKKEQPSYSADSLLETGATVYIPCFLKF